MSSWCRVCQANTRFETDDARGHVVCTQCGTVVEENTIVSEVTFTEGAGGAASADGVFVGADARRAGGSRLKVPTSSKGPGATEAPIHLSESREATLAREIRGIAGGLNLSQTIISAAEHWFKVLLGHGFTRGRKFRNICAACLYIASRLNKGSNFLIDFSEAIQTDLFEVGATYVAILDKFHIKNSPELKPLDPSLWIRRFAARCDFGDQRVEVEKLAITIINRMKVDWLHVGRKMAGLCAAALMIAGRAMHFTRTQREMAALVKVCEATLRTRMEEFGATPSAQLTVKEFSALKDDELEANPADPPAFERARKAEAAKSAASKMVKGEMGESANTAPHAAKGKSAGAGNGVAKGRKQRDREMTEREREEEEDRLAEEEADADNTLTEGGAGSSVGGRDTRIDAFEEEIADYLPDATAAAATLVNPSQLSNPPASTVDEEGVPSAGSSSAAVGNEPIVVEDDHLSEFDDDDDVAEALNDEDEVKEKERIWSWEHEDWLAEQDEKARKRLLDEANGIFEQPKKPRKKRKATEDEADGEGGWKRSRNQQFNIEDVARAVVKGEAGVKGSSRVNYGALFGLFKIPKDAGSSAEGAAGTLAEGAGATADEREGASADEEEM